MQFRKGRTGFGDHQATGRIPVKSVRQLQEPLVAPRAQGLDKAELDAAATMHRQAGRLVDDQQAFVLEESPTIKPINQRRPKR